MPQGGRKYVFLSLRFDGPYSAEVMSQARDLKSVLEGWGYAVFLCATQAGNTFGGEIARALAEGDVLVCLCTPDYGMHTGPYSTYVELQYFYENGRPIIPVRLCPEWPPHQAGASGTQLTRLVLNPSRVYVDCQGQWTWNGNYVAGKVVERLGSPLVAAHHDVGAQEAEMMARLAELEVTVEQCCFWVEDVLRLKEGLQERIGAIEAARVEDLKLQCRLTSQLEQLVGVIREPRDDSRLDQVEKGLADLRAEVTFIAREHLDSIEEEMRRTVKLQCTSLGRELRGEHSATKSSLNDRRSPTSMNDFIEEKKRRAADMLSRLAHLDEQAKKDAARKAAKAETLSVARKDLEVLRGDLGGELQSLCGDLEMIREGLEEGKRRDHETFSARLSSADNRIKALVEPREKVVTRGELDREPGPPLIIEAAVHPAAAPKPGNRAAFNEDLKQSSPRMSPRGKETHPLFRPFGVASSVSPVALQRPAADLTIPMPDHGPRVAVQDRSSMPDVGGVANRSARPSKPFQPPQTMWRSR